jgi:hypothetical protein
MGSFELVGIGSILLAAISWWNGGRPAWHEGYSIVLKEAELNATSSQTCRNIGNKGAEESK